MKSIAVKRFATLVSVPWNAFVVAFMYYTLLAVVALGGGSPSPSVVAGAYAGPPLAYAATLLVRIGKGARDWLASRRGVHGAAQQVAA